ncbi:MFS transporter [Halococcus hamelinensis]|uniref:Sugar transporter n=1 Tax=Halococcus hamelinensis 100A6 TaxID=1132509 RepID=M0M0K8_9EURY|nr:MFS transporter [Halococcus hamelinensis]EMA39211.1 sugar transporter [Halococcus hamelinensis 100A6]
MNTDRVTLAAMVFAVLFGQVALYPGVPELVRALGATTTLDAGTWFLGAEYAGFVLFAGVWGAASDAAGRRVPFVVAGALGGVASYLALVGLATVTDIGFGAMLVLRFVEGSFTIAAFSLSITMLMDLEGGHGRNMGAAGIAIGSGTALGAPLGGQLSEVGPLVPIAVAAGLLCVVALLATRLTDRVPETTRGGLRAALDSLRERPALRLPYAFGFADRFTAGFFALVGTLYFRQTFDLDAGAAGLVLALFFAPFALGQYPAGRLSDRIGRLVPVVAGSVLYGVTILAVYLAPTVELASATMLFLGAAGALVAPATMALVTDLATDDRGTAMGGFNIAGSLGFLVGTVGGGAIADSLGFGAAFLAAALLEAGIVLVALPALLRLDVPRAGPFGGRESA